MDKLSARSEWKAVRKEVTKLASWGSVALALVGAAFVSAKAGNLLVAGIASGALVVPVARANTWAWRLKRMLVASAPS